MHSSPSLPAAQYMFRIGRSSRCGWSKTNVLKPSADIELLTVIRVLSNGITKHNKLSQKFRTPAFLVQIHIFITRKKNKLLPSWHVSLAENYQKCFRGRAPDPAGRSYSAHPDPLAGLKGRERGKGRENKKDRTERG